MDLDNGYFLVSFEQRADFNRLVFGGPWMIQENYLNVQVWHPNFDVSKPPSRGNNGNFGTCTRPQFGIWYLY
ncbi:hypothetical protein Tsubulata_011339 [Turnera subulata]|uniref:DUF4283 domain-containing protein n=1 Tax=Turnera subulata TaxID=218843 RepID=A0A9Q0FQW7_9ROSI|nr:hypothetical protein Tsubulata_011339 [Turnera subulata]